MGFLLIATAKPVTSSRFEIFAPIILPGNISDTPWLTDKTPDINSGNEVPIPTMKIPITKEGRDNHLPSSSAAFVKYLAAIISIDKATIKIAM
jgi:hypothetical protein